MTFFELPDKEVALSDLSLYLLDEYLIVAVVVSDSHNRRDIVRKTNEVEFLFEVVAYTFIEIVGHMRSRRSRAAVSADVYSRAALVSVENRVHSFVKLILIDLFYGFPD